MIVKLNHEILNKYRRQVNNHIFILFLAISLMFLSCSKNSEVNEMQQNLESAGETEKYNVYIMSTNGGGKVSDAFSARSLSLCKRTSLR